MYVQNKVKEFKEMCKDPIGYAKESIKEQYEHPETYLPLALLLGEYSEIKTVIEVFSTGNLNKIARLEGNKLGEATEIVMLDAAGKALSKAVNAGNTAVNSEIIEVETKSFTTDVTGSIKGTAEAKYLTNIEGKITATTKANLPDWVAESFTDRSYRTVVTNDNVTLYRTFGGRADAGGGFATTMPSANRIQAKIDTALLPEWGNTRMYEAVIEVPKGQVLNIGKVAEQYTKTGAKLAGQADQILLPQNWPLEWIKEIRVVPSK